MTPKPVSKQKVTPPELAARWGVAPEKTIAFIRSGELQAFDVSLRGRQGRRPRYLIDEADIAAFEEGRRVAPALPIPARRRRSTPANYHAYF